LVFIHAVQLYSEPAVELSDALVAESAAVAVVVAADDLILSEPGSV
jgi:hypothetical protein